MQPGNIQNVTGWNVTSSPCTLRSLDQLGENVTFPDAVYEIEKSYFKAENKECSLSHEWKIKGPFILVVLGFLVSMRLVTTTPAPSASQSWGCF